LPSEEDTKVDEFVLSLTVSGGSYSSYTLAIKTCELLSQVADSCEWSTAEQLIRRVRGLGRRVEQSLPSPQHYVVHNIVKRVLKLIREEYLAASRASEIPEQAETRLQRMLKASESQLSDYGTEVSDLRERVAEIIEELHMEVESSSEEISKQALEHIHASEMILTLGRSRTVERFLKQAAKTRKFQVCVAEGGPGMPGHAMAASLASAKIPVTVITDSAIFAMMARVNKVIVGTTCIMADGSLLAVAGTETLAHAAAHYAVPVLVLGATYKLSPKFLPAVEVLSCSLPTSPTQILDTLVTERNVKSFNPTFCVVRANLVTSFISNVSGYSPSYVLRQVNDLYHAGDRDLAASEHQAGDRDLSATAH